MNKPAHISANFWREVDSPPSAGALEKMEPLRDRFPGLVEYAAKRKRGQRGPQKSPTPKAVTIRIDPDVLASYKATGPGWQSRMNDILRRASKSL